MVTSAFLLSDELFVAVAVAEDKDFERNFRRALTACTSSDASSRLTPGTGDSAIMADEGDVSWGRFLLEAIVLLRCDDFLRQISSQTPICIILPLKGYSH